MSPYLFAIAIEYIWIYIICNWIYLNIYNLQLNIFEYLPQIAQGANVSLLVCNCNSRLSIGCWTRQCHCLGPAGSIIAYLLIILTFCTILSFVTCIILALGWQWVRVLFTHHFDILHNFCNCIILTLLGWHWGRVWRL